MRAIQQLKIEDIIEGIPGGFFIYRADGDEELLYANQEVLYLYNCETPEEFMAYTGGTFKGMVHPDELEQIEKSIQEQIQKSHQNFDYVEYRIIQKGGKVCWVEDFGHLVETEAFGSVFFVFVSDATEKPQEKKENYLNAIKNHELLQKALQSTVYSYREVYVVNLEQDYYRMIYPDIRNLEEVGAYTEAIRHHISKGDISEEDREKVRHFLQPDNIKGLLMDKNSAEFRYRRDFGDGSLEWCLAVLTVNERVDGVPVSVVLGVRSIEELIRKEEKQKNLLEDALLQAEKANEAKTFFLANMSHDVRTPMNAILGFARVALNNIEQPEKVKDCLEKIAESSNTLLELIDDVLDMSRIESGRLSIEETENDLTVIVENVYQRLQNQIKKKELNYSVNVEGVRNTKVYCDSLRLNQILYNVIENAVRFTNPHGKIEVTATQKESLSKGIAHYEFRIKDTGIGIGKDFMKRLFYPFEREQNTTVSKTLGAGLGLAVTHNIVKLMNGSIDVHSKPGEGSEFIIQIPFRFIKEKNEKKERALEDTIVHDLKGKILLLVEDNELNRELAKELLEEEGMIIEEAENGAVAVEMVKNSGGRYSCILMDLQMPYMDGYSAAEVIRSLEDPVLASVPIIALSANVFEEDKRRAMQAGMNKHLSKPIIIEEILASINQFL